MGILIIAENFIEINPTNSANFIFLIAIYSALFDYFMLLSLKSSDDVEDLAFN